MSSDSDIEVIDSFPAKTSTIHRKCYSTPSFKSQDLIKLPQKRQKAKFEISNDPIPEKIPLLLAKNRKSEDPTNWWISEKLDGVRCYWNGVNFVSRQGNFYEAPPFFIKNLPTNVSLDGELWLGRKMFQECVSIARCTDNGKNDMSRWHKMKYMVFDAPSLNLPFEARVDYITDLVESTENPYLTKVDQVLCNGLEHMMEELIKVENLGGEGIMLRMPGSMYEGKRSSTLLKVKTFSDAEATVIAYENGKGKYQGSIGALRVRNEDGKVFKIGSGLTDSERINPPEIGSKVTYKFQELSKDGIPRFPTYYRKYLES